jgi:PAS domain S-box-containing protein
MYKNMFLNSPELLCVIKSDGHFTKSNPLLNSFLGSTEIELMSLPFISFIHPDDILVTNKMISNLFKNKNPVIFENRVKHKDGNYRYLSWSFSLDESSQLLYGSGRPSQQFIHTEQKISQIYNSLVNHTIFAITDLSGNITEVNDQFCKISGFSREELIGKNHRIVNSGVHTTSFWTNMWNCISSGKTWSGMIENKSKEGHHYHVFSIISPIYDKEGLISNFLAVRLDMSETVQLKRKLKETIQILNETSAIAKVGGWELDIKTGKLNWTDETFSILEVEKKSSQTPILPEGLELFTEEARPIIEKAIERAIDFGEPYALELQAKTAKGNVLWVYTNGSPVYVDGKITKLSGTIQDINVRKEIEINYELERVKNIQHSKLASLGELSAGLAHEINNPLSIIIGNINLLKKSKNKTEDIDKRLPKIEKSSERINKIIKNLKKVARSSTDTTFSILVLKDLILEVVTLVEIKAKMYQTEIFFEGESNSKISCNEIEIEQVLIILINNSIDATKELDQRWVKISTHETEEDINIKVMDSGSGIPLSSQDKLFDPFYTTKDVGEGTGLGLSIAKGIIEAHNGCLEIDNDCLNTCFNIKLKKYID